MSILTGAQKLTDQLNPPHGTKKVKSEKKKNSL